METYELIEKLRETASLFRKSDPARCQWLEEASVRLENFDKELSAYRIKNVRLI